MATRSELPRSSASWHSIINDRMGRDAQVIHTVTECASPSLCRAGVGVTEFGPFCSLHL